MNTSRVDIIIPVYNVEPYLRRCLNSVLKQTYKHWRAICIDDGSTDGCPAILEEYAAKDSRFMVVHQAMVDSLMPVMKAWLSLMLSM